MTRPLLAASLALALLSIGCNRGAPTGAADGDAALGDRGPRRTDGITNSSPAPSVEPGDANRENAPVP
jgi:hypothetical protein